MTILPWQAMCIAHPFGHNHHDHAGLSPCEVYRMITQQEGEHLLPPMECEHTAKAIDDYSQTQNEKIIPIIPQVALVAIVFERISFEIIEQPFLIPPDQKCRSATLLSDFPLRAPPLV